MHDFFAAISKLLEPRQVQREAQHLVAVESDALTAFRQRPLAVLTPESQDDLVEILRLCNQYEVPFVARGSGTSLSGGSLPVEGGVVIGLNRMRRILAVRPRERVAVVEPGVVNQWVTDAAAGDGLYYAPDPSSQSVCTIGGNVAFNSGGAHCLKTGMTSNHVLGIKAVLPDGETVELGGDSLEHVGPDVVGLFVGSEGQLGIAHEITLRLLPKPAAVFTLLAGYESLEAAGDAVSAVIAAGLLPAAMEIMDGLAIEAAEAAVQAGYPDVAGLLIVEIDGEELVVEEEAEILREVVRGTGPTEMRSATGGEDRDRIWRGRKGAFSAVGRLSPDYIVQDGVVPRRHLGKALARIGELAEQAELRVANVFHAGDGNLHPLILYDGRRDGELERAEELAGEILRMCLHLGGSITGEHGVGMEKRDFLPEMYQSDDLEIVRRLRQAVDPKGLANPGKVLPPDADGVLIDSIGRPEDEEARTREQKARGPEPTCRPSDEGELAEFLATSSGRVNLAAGRTKSPAGSDDSHLVDLRGLAGIVEYEPSEFTITARAGTPLSSLVEELARHQQYLPFDPLLVEAGATLGGTVAANASGPSRVRHGGVRDFVLGVRWVDGEGRVRRAGGRVVKNAAGLDVPKLMVGARGRYGPMTEITLKVFPRQPACGTVLLHQLDTDRLVGLYESLARSPFELEGIEARHSGSERSGWSLAIRLAGRQESLRSRLGALETWARVRAPSDHDVEVLEVGADRAYWRALAELSWADSQRYLVKIPCTLDSFRSLESMGLPALSERTYSGAQQVIAEIDADAMNALDAALLHLRLPGQVLRWPAGSDGLQTPSRLPEAFLDLGEVQRTQFHRRIDQALDPQSRFAARTPV